MLKKLTCPYHNVGNDSAINAWVILLEGSHKEWSLSLTSPVKIKRQNVSIFLPFCI